MDTGLSSSSNYLGGVLPLSGGGSVETSLEQLSTTRDSSCAMGSEIVLRRIVKKLFNQFNEVQPNELDDEFIYQSTVTYDDYLGLLKYTKDEHLNCASLNKLENILSNFISSATIRRPIHTNLFSDGLTNLNPFKLQAGGPSWISGPTQAGLNVHLLIVLLIVGLVAWLFRNVAGLKAWKCWPLSFVLVGFIEFCMHKNELKLNQSEIQERCKNPSMIARLASLINYDYDNCQSHQNAATISNIAFSGVEYLSELIFQPIVHLGAKFGHALESYLNSFSGFNYMLAPIFPALSIVAIVFITVPFLMYLLNKRASDTRQQRSSNGHYKALSSPRRQKDNAIK